jgi:hypothetical protein
MIIHLENENKKKAVQIGGKNNDEGVPNSK